ncbi:MAG TPA: hypothetical protein VJN70_05535 [Gemmatimonadaceae bacterium]|nr:hypothetical protein [Gemmatimonadaceae bacterium]
MGVIPPNFLIARSYLARSVRLWLAVRLAVAVVGVALAFDPVRLSASAVAAVIGLTIVLAFVEVRWRQENALLGNLGVSQITLAVLCAIPPVLAEIAIRALVAR